MKKRWKYIVPVCFIHSFIHVHYSFFDRSIGRNELFCPVFR